MSEEDQPIDVYKVEFAIEDVYLLYQSVSKHIEMWAGGNPLEQEHLFMLKDNLYRIILDYKFREMWQSTNCLLA